MDGEKRIIPVGKMLKWRVGRAFPSKNLKNVELHNQQSEIATMEQC
jgi:hypothetical protein